MTNCKLSQKKIFGPQLSEEEVLDMIQSERDCIPGTHPSQSG